jgi:predicted thioesterase
MTSPTIFMNGQAGSALALLLLALLAIREIARVSSGPRWQALARALTVAATPIMIIFLATVAILIVQAFR